MPAATQSNTSAGYVDFDEYVEFQLQKTRHGIKWTDIITSVAVVAAFVVGYLLLFAILDHWVIPGGFSRTARFFMVGGLLAVTGGWLTWKVLLPYLKQVSGLYAAQTIETSAPGLKSTLLNLVDLRRSGREIPAEIRGTLEKRAAQALSKMDVDQAIDRRPLMRAGYVLLGLVVFACLYTVFSPKKLSFARAFFPPAKVSAATRTTILDVRTNPPLTRAAEREIDVLARSQVEVIVDLSGELPESVTLFYTTADRKFVDEPVAMQQVEEGLKQFRGVLNGENGRGILQETTFHVVAGDDTSETYKLLVNQPPSAVIDELRYIYPKYMELESKLQPGGNIDAWEGTTVSLKATVNQPVKTALLQFFDDEAATAKAEEMRMEIVDGNKLRAKWPLKFRVDGTYPRSYRIFCVGDDGQSDPEPTLYTQTIRPDRRPVVEIIEPRGDLEVPANAIIPLLIEARDPDFKLRYVTLRREKNKEVLPRSPEIFKGLQESFRGTYDFDLKPMNLKVGDVVTYWAEARDNKQPLGNLSEKRQLLELHIIDRIPEEDVQKQADEDRARIKQRIEEADKDENQEGMPDQKQQEEGEGGTEKQDGGDKPEPGDGQPQDKPDDGDGEDKQDGKDGDKPGDEGNKPGEKGKPSPDAKGNEPGEKGDQPGEQPEGKGGENQRPLDTDGKDDADALRRLLEKERQKQEQQQQKGNPDQKQTGNEKQDEGKPDQPDDKQKPGEGDKPGEQPEGKSPEKDGAGEMPTDGNKKSGDGNKPEEDKKPSDDKSAEGAGNQGGDDNKNGGSDKGNAQGKPTTGDDSKQKNKGEGGGDKSKPANDNANPTDKPLNGEEKPADSSEGAQRKKATGEEKGPAEAEDDPNAKPTQAKNKLEPKPGEKGPRRPSDKKPDGNTEKRKGEGNGSKNPDDADPARETKNGNKKPQEDSPDKRPTTAKEGDPERPAAKQDEQPKTGDDELKGEGQPKGQSSEKPDGGEKGSGKPNEQGEKGGNKPDPGDSSQKPGMEEEGDPSKPGEPGDQKGEGSQKTDGNKKPGEGKPGGEPGKSDKPGEGSEPGEPGDAKPSDTPGGAGQPGKEPKGGDGKSRGGANQGPAGKPGADDGDVSEAEKANLEYNKKAANLVLKRLQDDLEDGEVDQKLLDEFGWTKEDMKRYLERMKRTINQPTDDVTPKTEAQQQQIEEFLKGYKLRKGRSDRDKSSGGDTAIRRRSVPREFSEAFEAYQRSLLKKATRRSRSK